MVRSRSSVGRVEIVEDSSVLLVLVTDTYWVQVRSTNKKKSKQVEVIVTYARYRAVGKIGLVKETGRH